MEDHRSDLLVRKLQGTQSKNPEEVEKAKGLSIKKAIKRAQEAD
jgi:hypothetical protein